MSKSPTETELDSMTMKDLYTKGLALTQEGLTQEEKYQEALVYLEFAEVKFRNLIIEKKHAKFYGVIGSCYLETGNMGKAIASVEKGLELNSDDASCKALQEEIIAKQNVAKREQNVATSKQNVAKSEQNLAKTQAVLAVIDAELQVAGAALYEAEREEQQSEAKFIADIEGLMKANPPAPTSKVTKPVANGCCIIL